MQQFGKTITSLAYIYLIVSVHPINAARIKQAQKQATSFAESQQMVQEMDREMMQMETELSNLEVNQIMSQHKSQYWGESWATCDERLEDFKRREARMALKYDRAMEDGVASTMEIGSVALSAFSVAWTLRSASKNGCDWACTKGGDAMGTDKLLNKTLARHPCLEAAKKYVKEAQATGSTPEKAAEGAMKILFTKDCKMPTESAPEPEKTFKEQGALEEQAEDAALQLVQEFQAKAKQTSLVEAGASRELSQMLDVFLVLFVYYINFWFLMTLECSVAYGILATILTAIFTGFKALFRYAMGYASSDDLFAEFAGTAKTAVVATSVGCSTVSSLLLLDLGIQIGAPLTAGAGWATTMHGTQKLATAALGIGNDDEDEGNDETTQASVSPREHLRP